MHTKHVTLLCLALLLDFHLHFLSQHHNILGLRQRLTSKNRCFWCINQLANKKKDERFMVLSWWSRGGGWWNDDSSRRSSGGRGGSRIWWHLKSLRDLYVSLRSLKDLFGVYIALNDPSQHLTYHISTTFK